MTFTILLILFRRTLCEIDPKLPIYSQRIRSFFSLGVPISVRTSRHSNINREGDIVSDLVDG